MTDPATESDGIGRKRRAPTLTRGAAGLRAAFLAGPFDVVACGAAVAPSAVLRGSGRGGPEDDAEGAAEATPRERDGGARRERGEAPRLGGGAMTSELLRGSAAALGHGKCGLFARSQFLAYSRRS